MKQDLRERCTLNVDTCDDCITRAPTYRDIELRSWADWRWQLRNRVYDYDKLCEIVGSIPYVKLGINVATQYHRLAVTPYTTNEMWRHLTNGNSEAFRVLWSIYTPSSDEVLSLSENPVDGTGEDIDPPTTHTHQFFPDRVLVRISRMCPSLCRYCFVRHKLDATLETISETELQEAVDYVVHNHAVRDVIISGGDPLLVSDRFLEKTLSLFREIKHVQILRIDTKVPNSLPQRITPNFAALLSKFGPLYMNIHISHPCELTEEMKTACALLADHGIILSAHIPLLAGINDNARVIENLCVSLLANRVRPYMLIHYIKTEGAEHFRTPIDTGIQIMEWLLGKVSGLAMPMFVVYLPNGGGKVPLSPNYVVGMDEDKLMLRNFQGRVFAYEDSLCK